MSTIKSSTTTTTAYSVTADTTGTLVIQTGSTPTTAVTVGTDQSVTMAGRTTNPTTISVGGATPSTSGSGISFPATQSASSDVNTLDDYEEGTWTPSLGGTATYSQQAGTYKKVGGLVYVSAIIQVATLGTGSSSQISGFPFSYTAGPRNTFSVAYWASTVGNISYLAFYLSSGTTGNTIATTAAASTVQDGYGVFQNGTYVIFSGCYHAA